MEDDPGTLLSVLAMPAKDGQTIYLLSLQTWVESYMSRPGITENMPRVKIAHQRTCGKQCVEKRFCGVAEFITQAQTQNSEIVLLTFFVSFFAFEQDFLPLHNDLDMLLDVASWACDHSKKRSEKLAFFTLQENMF